MSRNNAQASTISSANISSDSNGGATSATLSPGAYHFKKPVATQISYNATEWASKMSQISIPKR